MRDVSGAAASSYKSKGGEAIMLTDRQRLFVDEYLKDFKPMAAAARAGYSSPPWSPEVRAAVDDGIRDKRELLQVEGALVLREVATIAFHDVDLEELTPSDKLKALELLGKNLKLFTERLEISPVEGLAEKIAEGRLRAEQETKQLGDGK